MNDSGRGIVMKRWLIALVFLGVLGCSFYVGFFLNKCTATEIATCVSETLMNDGVGLTMTAYKENTIENYVVASYVVTDGQNKYLGSFFFKGNIFNVYELIQHGRAEGKVNIQKHQLGPSSTIVSVTANVNLHKNETMVAVINDKKYVMASKADLSYLNVYLDETPISKIKIDVFVFDEKGIQADYFSS